MRVAIAADHAGFDLKETVKEFLDGEHHEVIDVGTFTREPVDYPDFAAAAGAAVRGDKADRGIIICGSGVGASIAANRIPGVRAGLCHDIYSAHQGVEHDDMNVLVLGGRVVGSELAYDLVRAFLNARFSGDRRHRRRLAKMTALANPVRTIQIYGQSVWLDSLRRTLITSGELRRLIDEDGVHGVTSNPAIFEKAIAGSSDYDGELHDPDVRGLDAKTLYERLAVGDIQAAADALREVYDGTAQRDGYVSLEVSPRLAFDTAATLEEARRLWRSVSRDNLMIKVPATPEGVAAMQALIGEGINVNATLLFSVAVYKTVAAAYIAGLEAFVDRGGAPARVAGVASFFVSRIDTAVESHAAERLESADAREQRLLRAVSGRVAIANARLAYEEYKSVFRGPRWDALAARGAQTQRLLWASTGTKNPNYRDVVYVEELIGPDTVTTVPPATLDAFRDHGCPRASLTSGIDAAADTMRTLAEAGIPFERITASLLADGVKLFVDAFDTLLAAVEKQARITGAGRLNRLSASLPPPLSAAVTRRLHEWRDERKIRRLWGRDASLWTGHDEASWLGWLAITNGQLAHIHRLERVRELARNGGFSDALLLGMGGSSLAPDVLRSTFGRIDGFPALHVLDSTDPAQVQAFERRIDLAKTIFIVSSKSGSTLEVEILRQHFFDRVVHLVGPSEAGRRFVAITDPGSRLQTVAEADGFRHVFFGWPSIGGRYSALSDFGLVPAAIMGVDIALLLNRTEEMVSACMPTVPIEENPGVRLGLILGVAAAEFGRDKITIVASPGIAALGAWLEQLVAESTGKDGKALIPIDGEALGPPEMYGRDRLFVYLRLLSATDPAQDQSVIALERAGHPVVRIALDDPYDIGEEFFRWQIATAVAAAVLHVHPFDQPDVEAGKVATRRLTAEYDATGVLPAETPIFTGDGVQLFTDERNAAALAPMPAGAPTLTGYLKAHLQRLGQGDYFALLAYLEMNEANDDALQQIRHDVRQSRRVATCLEFGPRFLHSVGQAYKGGPNTGVFLQVTCDEGADIPVPGQHYTFGMIKAAQARGDFEVLLERRRRALRVHLGSDVAGGLAMLRSAVAAALKS